MQVSQSYGYRRQREIAARLAAIRSFAVLLPVAAAPIAPMPSVSAPDCFLPVERNGAAQVAAMQAERTELRADLPQLRAAAIESQFHGDGPTLAEVEAVESRLRNLDDYLIFEVDPQPGYLPTY